MVVPLVKDGLKAQVRRRPLGKHSDVFAFHFFDDSVTWRRECQQSMIVSLQKVRDNRGIVTLIALHVSPEKHAADIASDLMWLGVAIKIEPSSCARLGVVTVRNQQLSNESVPWFVLANGFQQIGLPLVL